MPQTLYMLDGQTLKSIPLHALPESAFQFLVGGPNAQDGDLSPVGAFNVVPWLYRGVDIRAKAVSSMPFAMYKGRSKVDVSEASAYEGILRGMKERLYRTEAALCLSGGSYWMTDTNRWGLNVTPRWVVTATMIPQFNDQGLTGFKRKLKHGEFEIPLEQVVYFWMPSLEVELGPGTAPAKVALRASGVLHNLDSYTEGYFNRGAVRSTLLLVDGNPPPAERNRIKDIWRRFTGVGQSYEAEIFSKQVEPKTIGDSPKDTAAPELTRQKREDVSTALGVPQTLLFSDAATNATAFADRLSLYDNTIVPQCELIQEAINEQLLKPLGLRLEFQPKRLEVYQQAEVQKAAGISMLLPGKAIMSINEARALLELDPVPGGDWEDEETRRQEQLDLQRQKLQQPQIIQGNGDNEQGQPSGAPENGANDNVAAQQKAMIDAVLLAASELKAMREAMTQSQ